MSDSRTLNVTWADPAIVAKAAFICAEGEVIHMGRLVATAQARIVDAARKLYAHATTTCMILRPTE